MTFHNTLGRDFTLRIATELHLKRMVVGGFERVFELGRIFRNEVRNACALPRPRRAESLSQRAPLGIRRGTQERVAGHSQQTLNSRTRATLSDLGRSQRAAGAGDFRIEGG